MTLFEGLILSGIEAVPGEEVVVVEVEVVWTEEADQDRQDLVAAADLGQVVGEAVVLAEEVWVVAVE